MGAILGAVAWVWAGLIALAGIAYAMFGAYINSSYAGDGETLTIGLLIAVGAFIAAAITWAHLMLLALVAKYIAMRTE